MSLNKSYIVFVCFGRVNSQNVFRNFTFVIIDYFKCHWNGSSRSHLNQMLEFSLNLPTTSSKDIIFFPSGDVQAFVTDSLRLRTETDVLSDILAENPQEVTEAKEEHDCLDNNHQGNNLGMMTGWSSQFEQQGKWTKYDVGLLYCCIRVRHSLGIMQPASQLALLNSANSQITWPIILSILAIFSL